MRKSAKTAIRNNNANNAKTVVVRTVAPKATENDVEEVIETVVENGVNYGSPNIKMMNVITIFKNGDYITEQHFYINGYKFRMDEIMRHSIKRYLMAVTPTYKWYGGNRQNAHPKHQFQNRFGCTRLPKNPYETADHTY